LPHPVGGSGGPGSAGGDLVESCGSQVSAVGEDGRDAAAVGRRAATTEHVDARPSQLVLHPVHDQPHEAVQHRPTTARRPRIGYHQVS